MERAELTKLVRSLDCAVDTGRGVFLCDPDWTVAERSEARGQMDQRAVLGPEPGFGWLGVRTGGTGGGVKFARHDETTLGAAVRGFCGHFGLMRIDAVGVLPLHHVSGLMACVRCAVTGGRYVPWAWKRLEAGETPVLEPPCDGWVLSLVPTQLQRLMARPTTVDWLRGFRIIFLGGGPVWPELAAAAAQARLPISISYGMTETAAMVTALRPEEFLSGERSCGTPLPHARVTIDDSGTVKVVGDSVFRGYWPEWRDGREFATEDLGTFDPCGRLRVLGRRDAMIISGGKKISPTEVEAALRASGEFDDVVVIGVPDAEWGEMVVACYPAGTRRAPNLARAVATLAGQQRPKRFVAIAEWPRNAQGKINRTALCAIASACGR